LKKHDNYPRARRFSASFFHAVESMKARTGGTVMNLCSPGTAPGGVAGASGTAAEASSDDGTALRQLLDADGAKEQHVHRDASTTT
jgi:hypothetical protein